MVSQYYPPENNYLVPSLAHFLSAKGHDVRVLTGYPNYPAGKVFEGYTQRWRQYEQDGAISVCRVPLFTDHSQRPTRRMLNYLSFGLSSSTAKRYVKNADVIYVYATQMTAAFGPWAWRLAGGAPYVLHVQDLWPDSILGSSLVSSGYPSRVLSALLNPWIRSVYRRAAAVVGIAPTMVETLVERGVSRNSARLVCNWADESALPVAPAENQRSESGATRILYAGNVGDMQDLETAVRAAFQARESGVQLTIVGDGVALPRVRALAQELGASNVVFGAPVPSREMEAIYREADFALVCLRSLPAFSGTIPSKFQAALSYGVPVISTVQGDVRDFVERLNVGFVADSGDPTSLELAFRAAARLGRPERRSMAAQAVQAYSDRFSLAAGAAALEAILSEAALGSSGRT